MRVKYLSEKNAYLNAFCFKIYQNKLYLHTYVNLPLLPLFPLSFQLKRVIPTTDHADLAKILLAKKSSKRLSSTTKDPRRMDVARTIFRFGNESFVIRPRRRIRLRTFLFALPPPPNHPPIPRTRGQLLSIPLSPPVIVCKSISIRGYRTCLFLMSSLIAARTSPLAGTSGRFTASGGFLYRSEELLEELVAALNREETGTHIREESRQSL